MADQKTYKFKASNWNKETFIADLKFAANDKRRIAREVTLQAEALEEFALKLDMALEEI